MDKIRALVSDELNIIEQRFCNLIKIKNDVFKDLNNFLLGKSKRIRSLISILYLKAFGKKITNDVSDILFVTELIHNASLLHDDVIDNSPLRRGERNLYDKYGSKVSVLSGDYVLSVAVEQLLAVANSKITDLFLVATKNMSEAEIIQLAGRNRDIDIEQYLRIICGKTASLFKACLTSCAMLSRLEVDTAANFAENFGILFQINNDLSPESVENDNQNFIKTAAGIIGIEKTLDLKDNYKEELSKILIDIPENKYKSGIEDLIRLL